MFALFKEGRFTLDSGDKMITKEAKQLGEQGEQRAVNILKAFGLTLARPDYAGHYLMRRLFYGEWVEAHEVIEFEIKTKTQPFYGPPFRGHGTDIFQIEKRMGRYKNFGVRQFFLVLEKNGKIYVQWLHKLEAGRKYDTPKRIRVYPIGSFYIIPNIYEGEKVDGGI